MKLPRVRQVPASRWIIAALLFGCSVQTAKNHYVLAEKLWTDGKHAAAVSEFETAASKDPRGKLGRQALYRAAMTQTLYLGQHADAIRKFRSYIELSQGSSGAREAQRQIGEILFTLTEQYELAIQHYDSLVKSDADTQDTPEFMYRIGKSQFYLWQFSEAAQTYQTLAKKYPQSVWAEKAAYELGVTYFTRGDQGGTKGQNESYQAAIKYFETFIKQYPKSALLPHAEFGIANCYEEMDQLDTAYQKYKGLLGTYPSPNVIRIKMARIKERQEQRSR